MEATPISEENQWALRGGGDRVYLAESSIRMIKDHPVFGIGLDQFNRVYTQDGYIMPEAREPELRSPHNIYLHVLVEAGLVGAIPMFLLWGYMLYYALKVIRENNPYGIAFFLGLLTVFVHGIFDYIFLQRAENQVIFFFLAIIMLNAIYNKSHKNSYK